MKYEIKMIGENKLFTVTSTAEEMDMVIKYGTPNTIIKDDDGRWLTLANILYVQPKAE